MRFVTCRRIFSIACGGAILALAVPCQAHFLWVKTVTVDGKPQGLLFFGESPTDEAYHFPEKLAKTKLWSRAADGKQTEVATKGIDTDDRVGLIGPLRDDKAPVLQTSQQYGIYGTALLSVSRQARARDDAGRGERGRHVEGVEAGDRAARERRRG